MSASINDLPTDIVHSVLELLDTRTLQLAKLVNIRLLRIVSNSAPLSYKCSLYEAGLEERGNIPVTYSASLAHLSAREKQARLFDIEQSWTNLSFMNDNNRFVLSGIPSSSTYLMDFADDVVAIGENVEECCDTIMSFDLMGKKIVRGKIHRIGDDNILQAVALSLCDHDLIVVLDEFYVVHFYQFSTGKPHPLASNPQISLSLKRDGGSPGIEVSGNYVFLNIPQSNKDNLFFLMNWKTALPTIYQKCEARFRGEGSFAFVSRELVLCPSDEGQCLWLLRFQRDPDGDIHGVETCLVLRLPPVRTDYTISRISCSCRPGLASPFGDSPDEIEDRRPFRSAFTCSPGDALVKITFCVTQSTHDALGGKDYIFGVLIHRRTILGLSKRYSLPQGTRSQEFPKLSWEEWGRDNAYICLQKPSRRQYTPLRKGLDVFGQRFVRVHADEIALYDFNPSNVRKVRQDTNKILNEDGSESGVSISVVNGRQTLASSGFFLSPVEFSLPYVRSVKKLNTPQPQYFALDGDFVVGFHIEMVTGALITIDVFPI